MRILAGKILLRLLGWLPLRLLHVLAVPLGWLVTRLPWRKHAVVRANLAACFPELSAAQRETLWRQNMRSMACLLLEAGAVWYWPKKKLLRHIRQVEGAEQVGTALARGRGVIVVGAHLDNWEILNLYCATLAPMIALYRAPDDRALDSFITASRQRTGATLVPSGSQAMRHMIRQLRAGGLIGLLCDQQPKQGEGVFAPFFGVPALTMTLVQRLASRTGCAVIMVSCQRLARGRGWNIILESAPEKVRHDDPVSACAALNLAVEEQVRRAPADYLWLYKRFGRRPQGAPEIYPHKARKRKNR